MSASLLPSLPGLGWPVQRATMWSNLRQQNVSGTEVAKALWSYPIYRWEVVFNVLRYGTVNGQAYTEMQALISFYNARQGGFDSFLYQDSDDNAVTGQYLGLGDGANTVFKLKRSFGAAAAEPIYAPNLSLAFNVYDNGVLVGAGNYTTTPWGTANANGPGCVIFNSAPVTGHRITADFNYFWPCHFQQDQCEFEELMQGYWTCKKLSFQSIK